MPSPASNAEVSSALYRCLSPDPAARPTAAELRAVLSGRGAKPDVAAGAARTREQGPGATGAAPRAPVETAPRTTGGEPIVADGIELLGLDGGRSLRIAVRTELGKALVRRFGPDAEFWDDRQCVLERVPGRGWVVSPVEGTTNETLVNGEALTARRVLRHGDLIAVGRQAKGVAKMPLIVRGR
jgi:eukaryotic-like serine/threonine-protein kinase